MLLIRKVLKKVLKNGVIYNTIKQNISSAIKERDYLDNLMKHVVLGDIRFSERLRIWQEKNFVF